MHTLNASKPLQPTLPISVVACERLTQTSLQQQPARLLRATKRNHVRQLPRLGSP